MRAYLKEEFNKRMTFIRAMTFAQELRTANEIAEHTPCTRRAVERWRDAGILESFHSLEPIIPCQPDGGSPTHLQFKVHPVIQEELNKLKKELGGNT